MTIERDSRRVTLADLSWTQVKDYLAESDTVIVPVGATEQHGPSCPVKTDALIAEHLALLVGEQHNVLVAPTIPFGDSLLHLVFPGTISLKPSTLLLVIKDYVMSLHSHGFRRFLVINGHADNLGIIFAAFSELGNELQGMRYFIHDFWDFSAFRDVMEEAYDDRIGGHADATDAAIVMAIDSALVQVPALASGYAKVDYWISRDLVPELYTETGVINSDQRMATPEIGKRLIEESVRGYSRLLDRLRGDGTP